MRTLFALLLLTVPLQAAEKVPSYLVQVQVEFANGNSVDNGTGSLIAPDEVLTAWHNLRNYRVGGLRVVLSDGTVVKATPVKRERLPDLALLKLEKPTLLPFVQLADEEPQRGDSVTIYGYPFKDGEREFFSVTGQVQSRYSAERRARAKPILYRVDKRAKPGVSGGPVINKKGQQCGVLFGSTFQGFVVGIEAILEFLEDNEDQSELLQDLDIRVNPRNGPCVQYRNPPVFVEQRADWDRFGFGAAAGMLAGLLFAVGVRKLSA